MQDQGIPQQAAKQRSVAGLNTNTVQTVPLTADEQRLRVQSRSNRSDGSDDIAASLTSSGAGFSFPQSIVTAPPVYAKFAPEDLLQLSAQERYDRGQRYLRGEGVAHSGKGYKYAYQCFLLAAADKLPAALFSLGNMHEFGMKRARNPKRAMELYHQAAELGSLTAQAVLGQCYEQGRYVIQDLKQAVHWYGKAIRQMNPEAEKKMDLVPMFACLSKAAAQGNPDSQFCLGLCYQMGYGVAPNGEKAMEWYVKAAVQLPAEVAHQIGTVYFDWTGGMVDHDRAFEWFGKAAEQGHALAQWKLAMMYACGVSLDSDGDARNAFKWHRKAADQGLARAQLGLANCYETGEGVEQNQSKAVKWFAKAAAQADAYAQIDLGLCYEAGNGVAQDHQRAFEWVRKAAYQDLGKAQCKLGDFYANGIGIAKDAAQAYAWYAKAANQGDPMGQFRLGNCYEKGEGVTKNPQQAVTWYLKAADQYSPEAWCRLGDCYKSGIGVMKDLTVAIKYYSQAAEVEYAQATFKLGECHGEIIGSSLFKDGNG
jgi:TPR repeat protein